MTEKERMFFRLEDIFYTLRREMGDVTKTADAPLGVINDQLQWTIEEFEAALRRMEEIKKILFDMELDEG